MRRLSFVLVAIFCLCAGDVALAAIGSTCPSLQNQRNHQLPPVAPMNQATYLCNNAANASDPPRLGDLSVRGQMENVQLCDSNCQYRPLFPEDPDSPLIPEKCGMTQNMEHPYAINGNTAVSQAANQGPPPPYVGTGGNCQPLMIPQAPINLDQQPAPTVKQTKPQAKPQATPVPSPSPSPAATATPH